MGVLAAALPAAAPRRAGLFIWIIGGVLLIILSIIFNVISQLLQSGPVGCVPPQCTLPPPRQGPLPAASRYTSSRYGFSLNYSTANVKPSHIGPASIAWSGTLSDGSDVSWSLTGTKANGLGPQQIVSQAQSAHFPDAQQAYTVPDASLGYNVGYGNVYDVTVSPADGQSVHDRLLVFASIRHGVVVVLMGLGPYQKSKPSNDSQPNPADTPLVELGDFEENINSVTWKGEQPF